MAGDSDNSSFSRSPQVPSEAFGKKPLVISQCLSSRLGLMPQLWLLRIVGYYFVKCNAVFLQNMPRNLAEPGGRIRDCHVICNLVELVVVANE